MTVYKAVCFDLFDTIIVMDQAKYRHRRSESLRSLDLDVDEFNLQWDSTSEAALRGEFQMVSDRYRSVLQLMAQGEKARNLLPELLRQERIAIQNSARVVDGIPVLFKALLAKGQLIAIISNSSSIGPLILEITGLRTFIDEAVFSFVEKLYKPEPDIYLLACDRMELAAHEVVFVSDGDRGDLTGASLAGLDTIQFDPTESFRDQFLPPGCYQCKTVEELTKRLQI